MPAGSAEAALSVTVTRQGPVTVTTRGSQVPDTVNVPNRASPTRTTTGVVGGSALVTVLRNLSNTVQGR